MTSTIGRVRDAARRLRAIVGKLANTCDARNVDHDLTLLLWELDQLQEDETVAGLMRALRKEGRRDEADTLLAMHRRACERRRELQPR